MVGRLFAWDEVKDRANRRKHGIGFDEAARVFLDPLHVSVQDRVEDGELRWQTTGLVDGVGVVRVAHTLADFVDEGGATVEMVRIVSARIATRKERKQHEQG